MTIFLRSLRRAGAASLAAAAFGLAAPPSQAAPLGVSTAPTPTLDWAPCDDALLELDPSFECATATVPLDYRDPQGQTIDLAVSRLPATGTSRGSVFVNPGGPGAPGIDSPTFATERLRESFDIVGFDPRGVGASDPQVRCAATSEEAAELLNPTFPTSYIEEITAASKAVQGSQGCRRSASIASHMSTGNVARDLELLRRAVGDSGLSFLGFSSGTLIAETYANLFPATTRALALDGTLDPVRFTTGRSFLERYQPLDERLRSYEGTDQAVSAFLADCAANPATCAFTTPGATAADLRAKFDALIARVARNGGVSVDLYGEGPETIAYQDLIGMIYGELNVAVFTAQDLAGALEAVDQASRGAARVASQPLADLVDVLTRSLTAGQSTDPDAAYDNFQDAFTTFVCNDTTSPSLTSTYGTYGRIADSRVRGFGPFWIWTTSPCATFPVRDRDAYTGPWSATTPNPVLMLGNRLGDPSVRYENAVLASKTLARTRLLPVDMYGHTSYNLASSCVDDAVDSYLIDLELPAAGASCELDFGPFDAIDEGDADTGADTGYRRGTAALR